LQIAYTVTHKRCKNTRLNVEKLNDAVFAKRIFELTLQNLSRKFENNNEFELCKEN